MEGEGAGLAEGPFDGVARGATETGRGGTEGPTRAARGGTEGVAGGEAETARGATEGGPDEATDTARGGTEGLTCGGTDTARAAAEGVAGVSDTACGGTEGLTCGGTETARGGTDGVATAPGAVRAAPRGVLEGGIEPARAAGAVEGVTAAGREERVGGALEARLASGGLDGGSPPPSTCAAMVGSFGARGTSGDRTAAAVCASDVSDAQSESMASVGGADMARGAIEAEAPMARGLLLSELARGVAEVARGAVEEVTVGGREERVSPALSARLVTRGPTPAAGLGAVADRPGVAAGRGPVAGEACATVGSLGAGGTAGDRSAAAISVSEVSSGHSESIVSVGGTSERGVATIFDVDRLPGRDDTRSARSPGLWGSRFVLIASRNAHLNLEDESRGTRFQPGRATRRAPTVEPDGDAYWTKRLGFVMSREKSSLGALRGCAWCAPARSAQTRCTRRRNAGAGDAPKALGGAPPGCLEDPDRRPRQVAIGESCGFVFGAPSGRGLPSRSCQGKTRSEGSLASRKARSPSCSMSRSTISQA